jgi:FR47-like protein
LLLDARVQRSVVANLRLRPNVIETGPFVIGQDATTDSRNINYATPQLDAGDITPGDVAALVAAFRDIGCVPRLEYVTSGAPALEQLLLDAGFTVEARHDYLVCSPGALTVPPLPDGYEVAEPTTDALRIEQLAVQNEAFGGEPVATPADAARLRRQQDNGGVVLQVRDTANGKPFRRRGIAGALTAAITERLFAAGAEVAWLEAGGQDSWRVYERVGYVPTGKRLYIALD